VQEGLAPCTLLGAGRLLAGVGLAPLSGPRSLPLRPLLDLSHLRLGVGRGRLDRLDDLFDLLLRDRWRRLHGRHHHLGAEGLVHRVAAVHRLLEVLAGDPPPDVGPHASTAHQRCAEHQDGREMGLEQPRRTPPRRHGKRVRGTPGGDLLEQHRGAAHSDAATQSQGKVHFAEGTGGHRRHIDDVVTRRQPAAHPGVQAQYQAFGLALEEGPCRPKVGDDEVTGRVTADRHVPIEGEQLLVRQGSINHYTYAQYRTHGAPLPSIVPTHAPATVRPALGRSGWASQESVQLLLWQWTNQVRGAYANLC